VVDTIGKEGRISKIKIILIRIFLINLFFIKKYIIDNHIDGIGIKIALTKELKRVEWVEIEKISKPEDKSQASIQ